MIEIKKVATFTIGCLFAASCTQDKVINHHTGEEITLSTFDHNQRLTKSLATGDKIAVSATKKLENEEIIAFQHQVASNLSGNEWAFDQAQYWDSEALNYDFIAYAPAQANNLIKLNPKDKTLIWEKFEVHKELTQQTDLLAGKTYATSSKNIQLTLHHLLSQINIKFKIDELAPESYTAQVKSSKLTFEAPQLWDISHAFDTQKSYWKAKEDSQTEYNFELTTPFTLSKEEQVAPGMHNLLLVPHQLENTLEPYAEALNFTLEYSFLLPGNKEITGEITFETETWEAGHRYNYVFVLQDDGSPTPCDESLDNPSDYIIFSPCYSSWDSEESSYFYYI